ncbi:MAG: DUF4013 domain-containing protein [Nanoarchaeota archaeon]
MDFETNFKKPFTDVKKLLIGIVFSILPIINFFAMGYMLETAKRTMKKDPSLPEWTGWGNLFVKGLLSIVIEAIYFIPAAIVSMVILWPTMVSAMPMMMAGQVPNFGEMIANLGSMAFGLILAGLLALFAAYVAPSAIFHYINSGFNEAFNFGSVFKKAFSANYGMAWILFIVYSMLLGSLLRFIPYVGSGAATFIAGITGYSLIAEAFGGIEMPVKKAVKVIAPKKAVKKKRK